MAEINPSPTFTCFPRLPTELREMIWGLAVQNRTRAPEAHFFRLYEEEQLYRGTAYPSKYHPLPMESNVKTAIGAPTWGADPGQFSQAWDTPDNPSAYLMSAGLWFACAESRKAIYGCWREYDESRVPGLKRYLAHIEANSAAKGADAAVDVTEHDSDDQIIWPGELECDYDSVEAAFQQTENKSRRNTASLAHRRNPAPLIPRRPDELDRYEYRILRPHSVYVNTILENGAHKAWITTRSETDLFVFQIETSTEASACWFISSCIHTEELSLRRWLMNVGVEFNPSWVTELEEIERQRDSWDWKMQKDDPFCHAGKGTKVANLVLELANLDQDLDGNFWFIDHTLVPIRGLKYADLVADHRTVFLARGRRYIEVTYDDEDWFLPVPHEKSSFSFANSVADHVDSYLHFHGRRGQPGYFSDSESESGNIDLKLNVLACFYDDQLD